MKKLSKLTVESWKVHAEHGCSSLCVMMFHGNSYPPRIGLADDIAEARRRLGARKEKSV